MNKTKQFNPSGTYKAPRCKMVELRSFQAILAGSPMSIGYGRRGEAGQNGVFEEEDKWSF